MSKKLYIMVGIPGSGKSTWLEEHKKYFAETYAIISRDQIRFNLVKENEPYFSRENEVFAQYIDLIKKSLENNKETYADATHLNSTSRGKLLRALGNSLKDNDVEINVIYIKKNVEDAIKQNENRKNTRGYVPESAIRRMNSQLEKPELSEGFTKIITVMNKNIKTVERV